MNCKDCTHFRKTDIAQGECWRFPPVPFPIQQGMGMGVMSVRPPVQDEHTCGEWKGSSIVEVPWSPGKSKL